MSPIDELRTKSLKFILAGTANSIFTYALYVVLVYVGLHYNLALSIDYIVGTITGYLMNRYWTFVSHNGTANSFVKYCMTYVAVFFLNLVLLNLFVGLNLMGPILGQLLAMGIVTILSFVLQNYWVFRRD